MPTVFAQKQQGLSKTLNIEFSEAVRDAINNGVTVTLNCQLAVLDSWLFFTIARDKKNHHFIISRHALSNNYIVKKDNLDRSHIFRSIEQAVDFISTESLSLLRSYSETDKHHQMIVLINKYELPGPMRLKAFVSSDWNLNTGWVAWE